MEEVPAAPLSRMISPEDDGGVDGGGGDEEDPEDWLLLYKIAARCEFRLMLFIFGKELRSELRLLCVFCLHGSGNEIDVTLLRVGLT